MNRIARTIVGIAAGLLIGAVAQAGDKEKGKTIQQSDLPPAVATTVVQETAGGTVTKYTLASPDGSAVYEIEMMVNGKPREIVVGPDGVLLAVKQEVAWAELPSNIQSGLQQQAGSGTIGKVTSKTKQGNVVSYKAEVDTNGKKSHVKVDSTGTAMNR